MFLQMISSVFVLHDNHAPIIMHIHIDDVISRFKKDVKQ